MLYSQIPATEKRRLFRERLATGLHLGQQPTLHEQSAAVLAHLVPDADRAGGIVLPQHLDAAPGLGQRGQRGAVSARLHHVTALVGRAVEAGIAGDLGAVL